MVASNEAWITMKPCSLLQKPETGRSYINKCNAGSGKYTHKGKTVSQAYRERLILKIGLERVELLESDNVPRKHTIDDLKAIQAEYKRKIKELTNGR